MAKEICLFYEKPLEEVTEEEQEGCFCFGYGCEECGFCDVDMEQ